MEEQTRQAVNRALRILAGRAHSERQLLQKLGRHYEEPVCAAALAELRELNLVDDAAYAEARAASLAAKNKSGYVIRCELAQSGVHPDVIEQVMDALALDELSGALSLIQKQYHSRLAAGERDKVAAALARRGFGAGVVRAAIHTAEQALEGGGDTL